jgi:hypothetical protein
MSGYQSTVILVISVAEFRSGATGGALGAFSTSAPAELTLESILSPIRLTALIRTSINAPYGSFQESDVLCNVSNGIEHWVAVTLQVAVSMYHAPSAPLTYTL